MGQVDGQDTVYLKSESLFIHDESDILTTMQESRVLQGSPKAFIERQLRGV